MEPSRDSLFDWATQVLWEASDQSDSEPDVEPAPAESPCKRRRLSCKQKSDVCEDNCGSIVRRLARQPRQRAIDLWATKYGLKGKWISAPEKQTRPL